MQGARRTALLLALWPCLGCPAAGEPYRWQASSGREAVVADDLSFTLPVAFHETTGGPGRTFRERGTSDTSYSTIHVQAALVGAPLGLDDAFAMVVNRFAEQDRLDVWDLQLRFVGESMALTYAADFVWLDVPRRQWGTLISRPDGLVGLFMTAPEEHFFEAGLDFEVALSSLQAP